MILEIKKLNALKKYTGSFRFNYPTDESHVVLPLCKIDGDVVVDGDYEIYEDDSVGIFFTLKYKLVGQCSYCLEYAESVIEQEFDVLFVTDKTDVDNYYYDGNKLNLETAVDEAILSSQPSVLLCKDDCDGIALNKEN